jgi:hypothetical protein
MQNWGCSSALSIFLVVLFVIALVLVLSVVTKRDCEIEADRANTIRAQLLTLLCFALGVVVLVSQRNELAWAVHSLME